MALVRIPHNGLWFRLSPAGRELWVSRGIRNRECPFLPLESRLFLPFTLYIPTFIRIFTRESYNPLQTSCSELTIRYYPSGNFVPQVIICNQMANRGLMYKSSVQPNTRKRPPETPNPRSQRLTQRRNSCTSVLLYALAPWKK